MYKQISRLSVRSVVMLFNLVRFFAVIALFYIVYKLLLEQLLDGSQQILAVFGLWIFSAYIALPRLHRLLTKYYLPNYFVGRVRSGSGLLSDPVNLAFFSNKETLVRAMKRAGWKQAEQLTIRTYLKTVVAILLRRSYPTAPVGNMYLFNRKQDFAFQIEIGGTPNARHHIRFWKTPHGWRLPGGHRADWLAAATYDSGVGFKLATGQIDHTIDTNIDQERDFIIATLKKNACVDKIEIVKHFTDSYHDHNNGGDRIKTDGTLPFITIRNV
ncbi:MAG TPA: LssY C-terminal domain-containing protein [Candidatus Saccharibacteria bacterium]|jgi:hypothetical protein|nr:LssY C-terminal domain-containing protein [Candidatus Saccharibacteria bacterium]HMT56018.1 LssY C-terminal domain-containing protein [Candidatus Saccharibacteria bacterium]